ncbi:MAG: glycosyl transferase [Burkholderiales bacterium]
MNGGGPALVAAAAVLAAAATAALMRWKSRLPLAVRNERTLHTAPIPRVGGLAVWAGFVPVALAAHASPTMTIATWGVPLALLVAVSLRDDMRAVPIAPRLAVHAAAALWFAAAALGASVATAVPLALLAVLVAWSLNLYNFMDGSDGLAATMTVTGFVAYGAVLLHEGLPATVPFALAAAALPVLAVNLPPARIFLGDVGAVPLGFLAAALGAAGVIDGAWGAWFPPLVFLPFVADATVTLVRRVLAGERFWEAHKSHYYQRLHRMGAGHRGTLAAWGALMFGTAGTAVACACVAPALGEAALAAWCAACAVLFAAIDYHWRKRRPPP